MTTETIKDKWYPKPPPMLDGEHADAYTNRLTGADGSNSQPYDHRRNRQCSIGWHEECSDPSGNSCECPCHREGPICNDCGGHGIEWERDYADSGSWKPTDKPCTPCGGTGLTKIDSSAVQS
jgi:hypothetical protein